ncbi:hypothetical protein KKC13_07575 [bacterium]|nr:hypothetical protein [bacterium]MBU1958229.1 hypothetical protein [bacterium]
MYDLFRDASVWVWEFLWSILAFIANTVWNFLLLIYENEETILPVVSYIVFSIVGVILLVKFFDYLLEKFTLITKSSVYSMFMSLLIGILILIVLSSFAFYVESLLK